MYTDWQCFQKRCHSLASFGQMDVPVHYTKRNLHWIFKNLSVHGALFKNLMNLPISPDRCYIQVFLQWNYELLSQLVSCHQTCLLPLHVSSLPLDHHQYHWPEWKGKITVRYSYQMLWLVLVHCSWQEAKCEKK